MTDSDINSSINNLIGTFATINTGSFQPVPNDLVCVDTSNCRIGINTIDPSYGIHIIDSSGLKVEATTNSSVLQIIFNNLPTSSTGLVTGQLYSDGGTLKIKLP